MDTLEKIVKENDSSNSNGLLTKIRKTIAPYVGAAMIGLSGLVYSGCGSGPEPCTQGCGDSDGGDSDVLNHPPATINDATVVPPDNSTYNIGDDITVGFDAPSDEDGDTLTGTVNVTGPDSETFSLGTLTPGQHYSQVVETAGMTAGDYTIEIVVSDGQDGTSTATRDVTLNALPEKPYVEGCNVDFSNVGVALSAECRCKDPTSGNTWGHWQLTTDVSGAGIADADVNLATLGTSRSMTNADIGLHDYEVKCGNGTLTSDPYTLPYLLMNMNPVLYCTAAIQQIMTCFYLKRQSMQLRNSAEQDSMNL